MKTQITDSCQVTLDSIEGFLAAFPAQVRRSGCRSLVRADAPIPGKVSVVTSGELMRYLGDGLADGCALAPSPESVLEATHAAAGGAGVLYLCGSDSGSFEMASAEAAEEGIRVATLAVTDSAGGFLVLKVAGARAAQRATLEQVHAAAVKASARLCPVVIENLEPQDEVAVLVNGAGALPQSALYARFREAARLLDEAGIVVYRAYIGEYGSTFEAAGASITLMRMDDELRQLLDAPAVSPCFVQLSGPT